MGSWTERGFVAQSVEDYKTQIQNVFVDAFGADFNVTDDTLPQCILIQELAELFANADADSIQVLAQLNPNTVSGIWLDIVALARGLQRTAGIPQTATVSVVSESSALPFTISQGQTFVCNETGESFVLAQAKTITSVNDSMQLKFSGEGNSAAAVGDHFHTEGIPAITTIEIVGLSAGTERETDSAFRARLRASAPVFNPTNEHIMGEIKSLSDIRGVGCSYNDTDTTTADGIPPYCTEFLVAPTANIDKSSSQYDYWKEAVGQAILWNKVPGSPTYGNVTVNIEDPFGTLKDVSFSVPEAKVLGIKIEAAVNEQSVLPDITKMAEIQANIADYVNSLPVGFDVAYSKIMQIFMAESTMDITKITIVDVATGDEYENQNFVIEQRQYAETSESRIEVSY